MLSLAQRLRTGEYRPEPGTVFVTERPKYREVHAAAYRDRVVQHLLHRLLEPRLERSFISDSFACRPGKGTHAAAKRLQALMWSESRHGSRRVFALQMDIRSFFISIHKPTLLGLFRRHFKPEERAVQPGHSPWSAEPLPYQDRTGQLLLPGITSGNRGGAK